MFKKIIFCMLYMVAIGIPSINTAERSTFLSLVAMQPTRVPTHRYTNHRDDDNGPCFPILEGLIRSPGTKNYEKVKFLVEHGLDVNKAVGPLAPLEMIADYTTDEEACKFLKIFAITGHLNIDVRRDHSIDTPVCWVHKKVSTSKQCFIKELFLHGATPFCPSGTCQENDIQKKFTPEQLAAHKQWKSAATTEVAKHITVTPLVGIVMGYCFSSFKK